MVMGDTFEPNYCSYQLLGDSQFVRFANQLMGQQVCFNNGKRFIGLCVSGQNMKQLRKRLKEADYKISKKVILLIGTNDLLQNTSSDKMKERIRRIIKSLVKRVEKVVLLTVPPVPRLAKQSAHWERLEDINSYIRSLPKTITNCHGDKFGKKIVIADVSSEFNKDVKSSELRFFERYFSFGRRLDLIHLNKNGLEIVRQCIDDYLD